MKRVWNKRPWAVALVALVVLAFAGQGFAQDKAKQEENPASVNMVMQGDSFFGFNPAIAGTYKLSADLAVAFQAVWWTDISGLGVHDANTWLETDLGVNLTYFNKQLSVTPMLGFVHGMLLSSRGGVFPNGDGSRNERTTAFEGIVPQVTLNWLSDKLEGEFYMGYYKALREEGGSNADGAAAGCSTIGSPDCDTAVRGNGGRGSWDFLHYWGNAGYRVNDLFSFGAHYEHLLSTRASAIGGGTASNRGYQQDYYRWIGPYVEAKLPGSMAMRFTFGKDMADGEDFYKLKFVKTF
jgi:hypothetical protein